MLTTALGASRLLARPGERRQWLLDAASAALWDLHAAGWAADPLADLLTERFGLPPADARAQVAAQYAHWQRAGLLDRATPPDLRLARPDDPVWPAPRRRPGPPGAWSLAAADRRVALQVAATDLRATLHDWFGPPRAAGPVDHALALQGPAAGWRLTLDDATRASGSDADAARVAVVSALTDLGCRPAERLLVVHGAGLVQPDGHGLLLVAPGGSGKSTLAAALDAAGFGLLSDDVVPVTLDGDLLGLGLPLCLKAGSWPVLAARRPDLAQAPTVQRFGQPVRCLPARTPAPPRPVTPARLVLIRWRPDAPLQAEPLGPEAALQGLVTAEAVCRDLTQAKLSALARWLEGLPAWRLTYPDLDQARAWLDRSDPMR
ncbi:MAG: hypothetical protein MUC79_12570 [Thiobacillaceae bacterium]|jgi:hypothetical protein|nr:hypothetical protein [Thiobacillaceae bacterium]